jgi:hypothetical protein
MKQIQPVSQGQTMKQIQPVSQGQTMERSITLNVSQINSQSTFVNEVTTRNFKKHSIPRSQYLPVEQFQDANNQKRMWLKAAIQEGLLRGNETHVLEALIFLTDPVNGIGTPSIGAIQEEVRKKNPTIHYQTVLECLKRLEQKGVIIKQQRGKKQTNLYTLIGYTYKSDTCYRDTYDSPNSSSSPKKEKKKKSKKDYNNSPSSWADARLGDTKIAEIVDKPFSDEEIMTGMQKMKMLREQNGF